MVSDSRGHRAGVLKQTNKAHKTGRHRSKSAIDNEQKGVCVCVCMLVQCLQQL